MLNRDKIEELYDSYLQIITWETETLGCKPTEVRHLIGRLGEFYCALSVDGTLAHEVNQHGFDVITKVGRTISVKTTAQLSGFVSISKSTLTKVDDLMLLQYKDKQISILYYGSMKDAVDGCREWDGKKIELDLTKAIKKNSQVGYKSFSTLK